MRNFQIVMVKIFSGRVEPVIGSVYPLEAAREAYAHYARGAQFGKIILKAQDECMTDMQIDHLALILI